MVKKAPKGVKDAECCSENKELTHRTGHENRFVWFFSHVVSPDALTVPQHKDLVNG